MTTLADRAVLVQLNISQWTARKFDKGATELVAQRNNASVGAGRYNKSLLPTNSYLDAVHKKTGYIRNLFYKNTLKWGMDGSQILPSANYFDFMSVFSKEKAEWNHLVNDFVFHYNDLRTNAQNFLGSLYNESEYPTADQVSCKFSIDMAVLPVPTDDFRVALGDEELDRIRKDMEARVDTAAKIAMRDVWGRLYERVSNMVEKLADMDVEFRASTIDTVKDVCGMLSKLNVMDDPNLEAMRLEVEQRLTKHNRDALIDNPVLRIQTAIEAKDIMDRMGAFMEAL